MITVDKLSRVKKLKIEDDISKTFHLSEAGQGKKEVKFSIIDPKTGKTITPFCKCKDYFTDLFWSIKCKQSVNVYGFIWNHTKEGNDTIMKKTFSIAIKLVDRDNKKVIDLPKGAKTSVKNLLNKFEKNLKFPLTKVEISDCKNHLILHVSEKWHDKPYLVSALFLLIRLGMTYDGKSDPIEYFTKIGSKDYIAPADENYFRSTKNKLKDLLDGKICKNQTFEKYTEGYNLHNNSGIVNMKDYSI